MLPSPIDVSRPLAPATATWPGDAPFSCGFSARRADGGVNVGWTRASVHVGTHVDAPFHFDDHGATADRLPLPAFHGPCRVVRVREGGAIPADAVGSLRDDERVLLRTQESVDATAFPRRFAWPTQALADALGAARAPLLGTDAPSMDAFDAKDLRTHRALAEAGIQILENLDLTGVAEGRYTLAAFPLRLVGMDGAPVRAVLLPE